LLVFIHVGSRKVYIAPSTFHPNEAWIKEQAKTFLEHTNEAGLDAKMLMHDRDTKFTKSFDVVLNSSGVETRKSAFRSPNTVAFVERFIQTIQQECLDYFIVFGEMHMDYLVREFLEYYHEERPHQGLGNRPISGEPPPADGELHCRTRLGGLLKHYYRAAA
jgi:putative transposase